MFSHWLPRIKGKLAYVCWRKPCRTQADLSSNGPATSGFGYLGDILPRLQIKKKLIRWADQCFKVGQIFL